MTISVIPNMNILLEGAYNDTGYWGDSAHGLHLSEEITYNLGNLMPGIDATQYLPETGDVGFMVKPFVAYFLGNGLSCGAEASYSNAAQAVSGYDGTKAFYTFAGYGKYDFGKGYIKVKPGFDSAAGRGFFVRAVFDAFL
jgi:hypothetical protein